jgi:hypothetical protein
MSEMVERVARAMFDQEWAGHKDWAQADAEDRAYWVGCARVAVEAMRVPTEAMKDRGFQFTADPCWPDDVGRAWAAMVDRALEP